MVFQRRSTVYVDAQGFTAAGLVTTSLGATAIQAALLGLSDADYGVFWEGPMSVNPSPSPVNAQFVSIKDFVPLLFATTTTEILTITLYAPKASIFYADLETVDPSTIAALVAAVVGSAVTTSGAVATAFIGGVRRRAK